VTFIRCTRCRKIAIASEHKAMKICLSCHGQELQRDRAMRGQEKVYREVNEKKEKRLPREERSLDSLDAGRALSDCSL
jgi:hypothetical protein